MTADGGRLSATAIVLAGGASRRMGADKALLPLGGRHMIEIVTDRLRAEFSEVLISAERSDAYPFLELPVVADLRPDLGPIMGIRSCLERAAYDRAAVVACDTPRFDAAFLAGLARCLDRCDAVVPIDPDGALQPTFAAYARSMLPHLERAIAAGRLSILAALDTARVVAVPIGADARPRNINTPEEYAALLAAEAKERS
jgi:molybdopterin-guanine dinucleotide biosynthesis protein A